MRKPVSGIPNPKKRQRAYRVLGKLCVREWLDVSCIAQAQASRILGITEGGMSRKCKGSRPWRLSEAQALCNLLGITMERLARKP